MAVEPNTVAGLLSRFECRWLAYIMQQGTPSQGWRCSRRQLLDHEPRVDPDIALRMKLRRLFDALHSRDFRQYLGKEAGLVQKLKPPPGRAFGQQLRKFIAQALRGDLLDLVSMPANGIQRRRFKFETKPSGETRRSQQAQFVLAKTAIRFADRADEPNPQISLPANIVEHFARVVAHQQPVNREIAALHVFLGGAREHYRIRMPPVRVANVSAIGCHLHFHSVSKHSDDAKLCP